MPFFAALEEEILRSQMSGISVFIQTDANSKLGFTVIPNDPKPQSCNGKILWDIIQRHGLIVINSISKKCVGNITRRRVTISGIEESIIDFVITSSDLVNYVDKMIIDEQNEHALVKITKTRDVQKSDHNPLITELNIECNNQLIKKKLRSSTLRIRIVKINLKK